ncbi:AMP-binding protein [Acinetobacter sp. CAAS 2-6]|uniref:AMP-binding protein n=1 Tax=Acinetobacter sp. CAAS 2-6 TaxID=3016358 RepID=UPI002DD64424|nr:AMP-binding protein [Acinetobacter sp. CAAS 2-6]
MMSPEVKQFIAQLQQYQQQQPQAIALQDQTQQVNYATLLQEVFDRQRKLEQAQVGTVALYLENSVDFMLWDLALLLADIPSILLPPFFSASQLHYCLDISQADTVIAPADFFLFEAENAFIHAGEFWKRQTCSSVELPEGTQKLTFTSGTTGQPKAVCLSSGQILRVAKALSEAITPNDPQHHLAIMPLAVLLENIGCYAILLRGGSVELAPAAVLGLQGASGLNLAQFSQYLQQSKPQSVILVPQILSVLTQAVQNKALNPQDFRFVAVGGGHVNPDLLAQAKASGLPVFEGYGLSECASVVALNTLQQSKAGSVGKPLPHVQVKIAEDGEILVAGNRCLGYLNAENQPDAYWPTGDLGHFDQEGYLYIHGRKKHQFITSFGRNVNPEWVESLLSQTGVIAQAFVYGEALPENYALLWPVQANATDQEIAQVVERANAQLPDYAQVKHWVRLAEPFSPQNQLATSNGRLKREAIVQRFQHNFI